MIPFAAAMTGLRVPLICAVVVAIAALAGVVLDRAAAAGAHAIEIEHLARVIEHNAVARAATEQAAAVAIEAERQAREAVAAARQRYEQRRDEIESLPVDGAGSRCPIDCVIEWGEQQ